LGPRIAAEHRGERKKTMDEPTNKETKLPKKTYVKPACASEGIFETNALGCTKKNAQQLCSPTKQS
jgi:hypothetical protein